MNLLIILHCIITYLTTRASKREREREIQRVRLANVLALKSMIS